MSNLGALWRICDASIFVAKCAGTVYVARLLYVTYKQDVEKEKAHQQKLKERRKAGQEERLKREREFMEFCKNMGIKFEGFDGVEIESAPRK
ncbi:hypothetical protein Tsubulata_003052 [Turnera subulata]|uniref:Uncharacterized protein n=1 Tax=Turnera subulata TaxID=218843 RepID=A0A9Q0FQD9_9ROSI|nr:hypothetical protein Tsubulata_034780 [Turnera subulata]KAJ4834785.1 hypothetical protein Tsubulata_042663 [Turnera subulata]KAJ4835967.1 hypothetical protein Tsubulata_003052 [Turnera subulata]